MAPPIVIIPGTPVLVPDLVGAAAVETAELRAAVARAVADLPQQWIAIGVGDTRVGETARSVGPDAAGTFAGYGVDVAVALSAGTYAVRDMPLCALIAGWVRETMRPDAQIEVRSYPTEVDALIEGVALRDELAGGAVGLLVVADGCHTVTPSAPGGYLPESVAVQDRLDVALASGDAAALVDLPASVVGRAAFAVLAAIVGAAPVRASELYRGAPYGVGYFVGSWQL